MNTPTPAGRADRRGVLLLLVLTALTFFMMIGTLMLVTATRTRTTSRAFADATSASAAGAIQARGILDEALLLLLRGRKDETSLPAQFRGQSILEDMYGTGTVMGQATAPVRLSESRGVAPLNSNFTPILTATLSNLTPAPAHCCDLNGRVLTFKPLPGDGDVASFRILRTTKAANAITVYLANVPLNRSVVLPKQTCDVVINGRDFCPEQAGDNNEGYDAYDVDKWLARVQLNASRVASVPQVSYGTAAGVAATCDNDNDGILDGTWVSGGPGFFPDRPSPLGGVLKHELSFHVVDLDGRMNVNAHGSSTPILTGSADWPPTFNSPSGTVVTMSGVAPGFGYGPADVSASRLVANGPPGGIPGFPGRWSNVCQAGTGIQQSGPSDTQRRPTPAIGTPVDGRYGADAGGKRVPGAANSAVDPLTRCALSGTITVGGATRRIGNSPTDLNVRVKMFNGPTTAGVPTLYFYTPNRTADDFVEGPYQLRLDVDGPRGQEVRRPTAKAASPTADAPFTAAELERVLRQYDADAGTLPPRLAAILDDYAERSRLTVTTDSWDTPAMAGNAMTLVRNYMRRFVEPAVPLDSLARGGKQAEVYEAMSPDVSAGVRFDINRPLDHPAVNATLLPTIKERYCRHLYTLLMALDTGNTWTVEEKAQWAANVCDFRDPDSTMTRFRYDANPADGWTADDNVNVFGAERPEVVITETIAYPGHLSVVLYHPWDAKIIDKDTPGDSTKYVQVEKVDPKLTDNPTAFESNNVLDLGAKVTNDSVWRLRVEGGATVALGDLTAGGAAAKLKLDDKPTNQYVCIQTKTGNNNVGNTVTASTLVPVAVGAGTLLLERLADPTKRFNDTKTNVDYNPYVVVDRATLQVAADATSYVRQRRKSATFWKQDWEGAGATPTDTYKSPAPWFHWPNRPFVSVAELALVPMGAAGDILKVGQKASPAQNPTSPILDACRVPSRFAGTGLRIGDDSLLATTANYESVCTTVMPRWREPGLVNVNTIASNTGNGQSELDDAVWKAVVGAAGATIASSPFATGNAGDAADSFTKMLSLQAGAANPVYTDAPGAPRDYDPFFQYVTAIRLANVATIRSNVFAVWITLRITDTSASAPPPIYRRVFAIIDRSVPVGFNKGETLNVRDAIRLQRFLD